MRREREVGENNTEPGRRRDERGEEGLTVLSGHHPIMWSLRGGAAWEAIGAREREESERVREKE